MTTIPDIKLFVRDIQHITITTYDTIALKTPVSTDLKKIKNKNVIMYLEDVIDEIDVLKEELANVQQSLNTVRLYAYNTALDLYIKSEQIDKAFQKRVTILLESHKTKLRDIMKVLTSRSLLFIAQTFPKQFQQAINNFVKLNDLSDDLEDAYMVKLSENKIELQYVIDILVAHEFISTRDVSESIKKLFNSHVVYALLEKDALLKKGAKVIQEDHSTPEEKESLST